MKMTTFISRGFLTVGFAAIALTLGCKPKTETTDAAAAIPAAVAEKLPMLGAAPAWKLTKIDGSSLSSDDLKGKIVVLDFWATWCPPCREEIPGYVEMQTKLGSQGVVIVGVSLDQKGPPVVKTFAEQFAINYPLVMGDDAIVQAFGGIEAIPTTFLIDRDGQVRHRKVGMMEHAEYEALVTSLL